MTREKEWKITIDKLAEMMNRSFKHLEERFSMKIEKGFGEVNVRLDKVEYRLDVMEGKSRFGHENRISRLEDDVRILKNTKEK